MPDDGNIQSNLFANLKTFSIIKTYFKHVLLILKRQKEKMMTDDDKI